MRYLGSSVETAKEVKLFGLNGFLVEPLQSASPRRCIATTGGSPIRRAVWGGAVRGARLARLLRRLRAHRLAHRAGEFSIGDLTFLAGSFLRLRGLLEGLLLGFSQIAGQALYLEDLFSFFEIRPRIASPPDPRPFRGRSGRGSSSRTSASAIPTRTAGRVRRLDLDARRRRGAWRWSARTAPARRRSSSCSRGSTTRPRGASCSTARTCATTTSTSCAATSA